MSPWHIVLVVLAGWLNREQQKIVEYLKAENTQPSDDRPVPWHACVCRMLADQPFRAPRLNPTCQGIIIVTVSSGHFILVVLAGWVHREQLKVIEYLKAENRALREQLGNKYLRSTDEQRRRLAVKGARSREEGIA